MPDDIKPSEIDVEVFAAVEGSQTSADGQGFALHARRRDGSGAMLVFPHSEISNIVENAAMQSAHGRDEAGHKLTAGFKTTSFQLGRGPMGEVVLSLIVGKSGTISFILPPTMVGQLSDALVKAQTRH